MEQFYQMEMGYLRWLEGLRDIPFLNTFFELITELGWEMVALGAICIIFWCTNKNFGYQMGFAYFASGMLIQGLKIAFRVPRPWVRDPSFKPVGNAMEKATGYSFPSGHTQSATTLFGSLALKAKKKWLAAVCIVLILLVGFSRNYLGVHYSSDVIVSMIISIACIFIFGRVFKKIENNKKYDLVISFILAGISLTVAVSAIILLANGTIPADNAKNALDCCKTGGAGLGFAIGWFFERKYVDYDVKTPKMWHQFVKLGVGIGMALLLKEIPKWIAKLVHALTSTGEFVENPAVAMFRYTLVTLWIVAVFPYIVKKVLAKIEAKKEAE